MVVVIRTACADGAQRGDQEDDGRENSDQPPADPFAELFRFFNYLQEAAIDFRTKYGENLHRSVHWSICAHALATIEPYVEEIVSMIVENGATPVMDIHTSAIYLTHAIGSCYLSEDTAWLNVAKPQIAKSVEVLMGLDKQ